MTEPQTGTPAVSIRPGRISDAADVAGLTAQLGYDVEPSQLAPRLERILAHPDQRFLVAEVDGRPVGWVHASLWESIEAERFALVAGLVVDRAHRRLGLGRRLMGEVERWARERDCVYVRLWSSAGRTAAHRFYEGLGYVNVKSQYAFAKAVTPVPGQDPIALVPRIET